MKKIFQKLNRLTIFCISLVILSLYVSLVINKVLAVTWQGPCFEPGDCDPPNSNIFAPINPSIVTQTKTGGLNIATDLNTTVGIGTSSTIPNFKLNVVGNTLFNNSKVSINTFNTDSFLNVSGGIDIPGGIYTVSATRSPYFTITANNGDKYGYAIYGTGGDFGYGVVGAASEGGTVGVIGLAQGQSSLGSPSSGQAGYFIGPVKIANGNIVSNKGNLIIDDKVSIGTSSLTNKLSIIEAGAKDAVYISYSGGGGLYHGAINANSDYLTAIYGTTTNTSATSGIHAIKGEYTNTSGTGYGVYGQTGSSGKGVFGEAPNGGRGVFGYAKNGGYGVRGESDYYVFYGEGTKSYFAGNVGIKVENPAVYLAIGDADTGLVGSVSDTLDFYTNGTRKMRIYSSGYIGIGTNSPSTFLEVAGQIKITDGSQGANKLLMSSNEYGLASWQNYVYMPGGQAGQTLYSDGSSWLATSNLWHNGTRVSIGVGSDPTNVRLDVKGDSSTIALYGLRVRNSSNTYGLSVRDDGNVSIGNIDPSATNKLTVGGDYYFTAVSSPTERTISMITPSVAGNTGYLRVQGGNNSSLGLAAGDLKLFGGLGASGGTSGDVYIAGGSGGTVGNVILAHNGSSVVGAVGIKTYTPQTDTSFSVIGIGNPPVGTTYNLLYNRTAGPNLNGFYYQLPSSRRYKENIVALQDDFYKILQIEPKSFNYIESGQQDVGYIAEDFDALGLKNLVTYNESGQPDSLKYDRIPLYILEVVKKQEQELEELKVEVTKAQVSLAKLKDRYQLNKLSNSYSCNF